MQRFRKKQKIGGNAFAFHACKLPHAERLARQQSKPQELDWRQSANFLIFAAAKIENMAEYIPQCYVCHGLKTAKIA